jgi:DNA-binding FadR family transcriptional regulator
VHRAYRRIMTELLDAVASAEIASGEWLPRVDEIAARHACSAGAAREAVRALEERRVVSVHAGQGQQVRTAEHWDLLDPDVAAAVLIRHRRLPFVSDAVEAMRLVETQAGLLAARSARRGDVLLLREHVARMATAAGNAGGEFADAESSFHRALMWISGNRFLAAMLESLHPVLAQARRRLAADRDPAAVTLHERIVAALAENDETATAAAVDDYGRHMASWLRA